MNTDGVIIRRLGRLEEKYPEVFLRILSVHYPFKHEMIDRFWDVICINDCFRSFFISDTDQFFTPEPGLCFNKNIEWNDWLYDHFILFDIDNIPMDENYDPIEPYETNYAPLGSIEKTKEKILCGVWNPFDGKTVGIPYVLPMDFRDEYSPYLGDITFLESDLMKGATISVSSPEVLLNKENILSDFENFSIDQLEGLLEKKLEMVVYCNPSIWDNFLGKYYNDEIVADFLLVRETAQITKRQKEKEEIERRKRELKEKERIEKEDEYDRIIADAWKNFGKGNCEFKI